MKRIFVLVYLALHAFLPAHAQLTVEEIVSLKGMVKMDAMSFLAGKGYKLDSCGTADSSKKDLTSVCSWKARRQIDQKLYTSELRISFSATRHNHVYLTPYQVGLGQKMAVYLKTIKAREEAYDDMKTHRFGKRYYFEEWVYDIAQSAKQPNWEAITVMPWK